MQAATAYNVERFFGWVSTTADFCGSFGQIATEARDDAV
jgi:ureidoacrylate peracid hydrolase